MRIVAAACLLGIVTSSALAGENCRTVDEVYEQEGDRSTIISYTDGLAQILVDLLLLDSGQASPDVDKILVARRNDRSEVLVFFVKNNLVCLSGMTTTPKVFKTMVARAMQ